MGTRASTIIKDSGLDSPTLLHMYRQFDGYVGGHGADLKEAFGNTQIINGFSNPDAPNCANGMGCFAAQLVKHFKQKIGGCYIYPSDSETEGYTYILYKGDDNTIHVKVTIYNEDMYNGPLSDLPTDE